MNKKSISIILSILSMSLMFSFATYADWLKEGNRSRYLNVATGQYVANNWLQDGNGFYFFDAAGYTVTGWYLINNKYYYFDENGLMKVGFLKLGDKTYYLDDKSGQMVTGWIQTYTNGVLDYYYFGEDGVMYVGWKQIGDKWFYFYNGKCIVNTFAEVNGYWYHFNVNGAMDTGWITANGKMYYFNIGNGSMMKGWIQDQYGNAYYLSEIDGSLTVNAIIQIQGIAYTFDSLGKCVGKDASVSLNAANINNVLGYQIDNSAAFGVSVGVSPGSAYGENGIVSFQNDFNKNFGLQQGSTEGPK